MCCRKTYGPTLFVAAQLIDNVRFANIDLLGIGKTWETVANFRLQQHATITQADLID